MRKWLSKIVKIDEETDRLIKIWADDLGTRPGVAQRMILKEWAVRYNHHGEYKLYHGYLDKTKVIEAFESLLISFQEEATTKWNSESERRIWADAYNQVINKMKELGIDDDQE